MGHDPIIQTQAEPHIAVIGSGHWGRNLVRNFSDLGALRAVVDADQTTLARMAQAYPHVQTYHDVSAIWADKAIRGVAIATPAATHGALVAAGLAAGKHVFVEKPLCLDVTEARSLRAQAATQGRIIMVGHLLLYHPCFKALKHVVDSGELGALRYIYSNRLSLGRIRREENALWSFAPHDISMILQLTKSMPISVSASGGYYLTKGVADTTLSQLEFANGMQAHVFVSWLHPYKDQRLVVIGEEAMIVFNDTMAGANKLLLYRHKATWNGDLPVVEQAQATAIPYEASEPLRIECGAFLDAIAGGSKPPSDADEGIRVLEVLDACQRAIERSRGKPRGTADG